MLAFLQPGTLVGWLTLALMVGGAFYFRLFAGGATAIESLEAANRVLEKRIKDLEDQVRADARTIIELRARTDIGIAMKPLLDWSEAHEARASERHGAMLVVLEQISTNLKPPPVTKPRARRAA